MLVCYNLGTRPATTRAEPARVADNAAPMDFALRVPEHLSCGSLHDIRITEDDSPYFNAELNIMIAEQPLAWPARFFPDISSKAEVLHRLLPELLKTGTINEACCFLQQHIDIRPDASGLTTLPDSAITKLFMAIDKLLRERL